MLSYEDIRENRGINITPPVSHPVTYVHYIMQMVDYYFTEEIQLIKYGFHQNPIQPNAGTSYKRNLKNNLNTDYTKKRFPIKCAEKNVLS